MKEFLDQVYLNNTVRQYLLVAGVILIVIIFKRYLSKYLAGLIFPLVNKITRGIDKKPFVNLVVQPLEIFLLILVTMIALEKLNFPDVLKFDIYKVSFHRVIEVVSIIILLLSFIWLLLRIIDFIAMILERRADLTPDQSDNQLIIFFKDFFKVVIVIIGVLLILKLAFNFAISSLVTGISIATAAIALATRESLENLIASFIIFFDKPFVTGDLVKVQSVTGTVEKIGLRSTRIRTSEKTFVTVPNKQMVDSFLDNLSLRTHRRAFTTLELHPQTSYNDIQQLIKALEELLKSREKDIDSFTLLLSDISKEGFVLTIEYFVVAGSQEEFNLIRQEINLAMIELMEKMKVRMSTRDISIVNLTPS